MRQNLTGDDLFAYVRLLSTSSADRKYILCEGDSDCAVLDPHLREEICETIPGYGKDSVVIAINLVEQQKIPNVGALVDRDWNKSRRLISTLAAKTDYYDMDATIFFTGNVCQRMVAAFCDRQKVREFLDAHGLSSPRDMAIRMALPFGVLRKLSYDGSWGLRIAGVPIKEVFDEENVRIDEGKLFDLCLSRSRGARITRNDKERVLLLLREKISSIDKKAEYCCGHDLNSVLAYLIQAHWGGRVSRDTLERAMRGGFSCVDLASTRFCGDIHSSLQVAKGALFNCEAPHGQGADIPPPRVTMKESQLEDIG